MAQYSAKERVIASFLSSAPVLKGVVKQCYILMNYAIYRKNYKSKLFIPDGVLGTIEPLRQGNGTFFGYYDKSPDNGRQIIFNETSCNTATRPDAHIPLQVNVFDRNDGSVRTIGETLSYNWQQGCRAQWVDDKRLIYNNYDGRDYRSILFDIEQNAAVRTYSIPVQDIFQDKYFLSINYRRVMKLRPDYGYRNMPELTDADIHRLDDDGIWQTDLVSGQPRMIVSLQDLAELNPKDSFKNASHKANHVMISPQGDRFIFIHRWYCGGRRFDRLILSDFKNLSVLSDNDMVSHMCWINNDLVFGYLRHDGRNGFYFIDLTDGSFIACDALNSLSQGDGHPSCHGDWIVVDTYPDRSRMQRLTLFNFKTRQVLPLLEVFQSTSYRGESRCDLHPRFSPDGKRAYFDSVFNGTRQLCYLDLANVLDS